LTVAVDVSFRHYALLKPAIPRIVYGLRPGEKITEAGEAPRRRIALNKPANYA
jgi:hypothetical protein